VANRARWGRGGWGLAGWTGTRATWDRHLSAAIATASPGTTFAVTDVRACYPSIGPETLRRSLGPSADVVVRLLERFGDGGVRGLPVGPDASAVLANAILGRLDLALRRPGVRHLRWVDDVVLWGGRADVVRALARAHRTASELGLELNPTKTAILADRDQVRLRAWAGRSPYASGVRAAGPSAPIIAAP
jgi:hypothetical protein